MIIFVIRGIVYVSYAIYYFKRTDSIMHIKVTHAGGFL